MNIEITRHSLAHVLALAVKRIYGNHVKFGTGPATETGFFYDFELAKPLSKDDFGKIQAEMEKIIKENLPFRKKKMPIAESQEFFKVLEQPYKLHLLKKLADEGTKEVTHFQLGDFEDLCTGPHLKKTGEIKIGGFALNKIAGAYWQGNEENPMLTRLSGLAFADKKALKKFVADQEEAKKRDHRKLGKELDLFVFSDLVGAGLPLYTPKGTILKDELQKEVERICREFGFQKISTPPLAKIELYDISGHAAKFGDELFHVKSHFKQDFVIRPVQCPHQTQIYASKIRSYRDLPIRYMESDKQYRDEKPGEISGLSRVIAITVEDGHSFCRVDQVKDEVIGMIKIIQNFYKALGFWGNHKVFLSLRDPKTPEKYIGDNKDWEICEKMLKKISQEMKLKAEVQEGEAALYGPKLDFMFKDAMGKEIQIPTVQLDFATPKRFNLTYIDEKGKQVNPVMVHRAILGSYERFIALLIEHFAGAFPVWLAPVQVKIISVGKTHVKFCEKLTKELLDDNIRVEADLADESVGKKIHNAITEKIPYVLVIGDKEMKSKKLAVRDRASGKIRNVSQKRFVEEVKKKVQDRT
jgi:threonyl-tRNA synthetase